MALRRHNRLLNRTKGRILLLVVSCLQLSAVAAGAQPQKTSELVGSIKAIPGTFSSIRDLAILPSGDLLLAERSGESDEGVVWRLHPDGKRSKIAEGLARLNAVAAVGETLFAMENSVRSEEELTKPIFADLDVFRAGKQYWRSALVWRLIDSKKEIFAKGFSNLRSLFAYHNSLLVLEERGTPPMFAVHWDGIAQINLDTRAARAVFESGYDNYLESLSEITVDSQGYLYAIGRRLEMYNVFLIVSRRNPISVFSDRAPIEYHSRLAFDQFDNLFLYDPINGKLYILEHNAHTAVLLASGFKTGPSGAIAVQNSTVYVADATNVHAIQLDEKLQDGSLQLLGKHKLLNEFPVPTSLEQLSRNHLEAKLVLKDAGSRPRARDVCIGYNPDTHHWGYEGLDVHNTPGTNCPKGYAFLSIYELSGVRREGKYIDVSGNCCPLPEDVLLDEHVFVEKECPEGFVATGGKSADFIYDHLDCQPYVNSLSIWEKFRKEAFGRGTCGVLWNDFPKFMRCTKVNPNRYRLGEKKVAYAWGWDRTFRTFADKRTTRAAIPVGMRYGIGRRSRKSWKRNGCIGYPWGSLFVSKASKYCDGFRTRQLQYIGAEGDPQSGTAVPLFTDCLAVDDPYSADARCIRKTAFQKKEDLSPGP